MVLDLLSVKMPKVTVRFTSDEAPQFIDTWNYLRSDKLIYKYDYRYLYYLMSILGSLAHSEAPLTSKLNH